MEYRARRRKQLASFHEKNLSVKANYFTRTVKLDADPLANYSFLYLSGISDFAFDDAEVTALRTYLLGGGFLLIDNSLGLDEFGAAVYREMRKVISNAVFEKIGADHAVFQQGPFKVDSVRFTLAARAKYPTLTFPVLEGLKVSDQVKVIYSPFDMAAGWQGDDHPLAYGYEPGDSLRLGANLITYCLTH